MGAGRKPKPTAMKELESNPGKRKLNKKEPMPGKGISNSFFTVFLAIPSTFAVSLFDPVCL